MKKIIILFILLFCSSCQDYHEINNIAIVSGISIEYINEKYKITYEIINSLKEDNHSYTISGNGSTIEEAINDIDKKTNNDIILSHLDIVIISKDIIIDNIKDFFMNNDDITTNFYLLYSNDHSNVLNYKNNNYYVNSIYIKKLLMKENIDIYKQFDYLVTSNNIVIDNINIIDNNLVLERN